MQARATTEDPCSAFMLASCGHHPIGQPRRALLVLFSFCIDIGRFPPSTLVSVANAWVNGLVDSQTIFKKAIIYTNLPLEKIGGPSNLEIRKFESDLSPAHNENRWQHLLTLKFSTYAKLVEEFTESPIWIDLDTFVSNDISYLDEAEAFCTPLGTSETRLMALHKSEKAWAVQRNRMINTSIFKVTPSALEQIQQVASQNKGQLPLGDQDAFNIAVHFLGVRIPALGAELHDDRVYSYEAWNKEAATHLNDKNSSVLFQDNRRIMRSSLHPGKSVDLIQFTFKGAAALLHAQEENANWFVGHWKGNARIFKLRLST